MYKHMADSVKETNERSFISSTERETFDSKAESSHNHDDMYYTKSYIDSRLDVLYKTVEGEHIKSTSVSGFTKDLEILGNTKQRVENTVQSPNIILGNIDIQTGNIIANTETTGNGYTDYLPIEYLDKITVSFNNIITRGHILMYDENKNYLGNPSGYILSELDNIEIFNINAKYVRIWMYVGDKTNLKITISRTHLDDIQSVGTKLGENNYQFDIIARSRNIAKPCQLINVSLEPPHVIQESRYAMKEVIEVKPETYYEFITKNVTYTKYCIWLDKDMNFIHRSDYNQYPHVSEGGNKIKCANFISPKDAKYAQLYVFDDKKLLNRDTEMIENEWTFIEVDGVVLSTETEPYESYKQTIELPTPLHGIDGIHDKLYSKNGHLYIGKNVKYMELTGDYKTEGWWRVASQCNDQTLHYQSDINKLKGIYKTDGNFTGIVCNTFVSIGANHIWSPNVINEGIGENSHGILQIRVKKDRLNGVPLDTYLKQRYDSGDPVIIYHLMDTPEIIDLGPVELFNIRTINGNIEIVSDNTSVKPIIKCKLPDSIGGTISSTNNAIVELKNEIKSLNSLIEKGNTDIEIKNGVGSIPNTHKGQYINDLSIEGKTLVNLSDTYNKKTWLNENPSEAGFSKSNGYFKIDFDVVYENNAFIIDDSIPINAGKTYTYIVNITENKLTRGAELFPYMWEHAINKSESEWIEPGFVGRKVFKFDCIKDTFFEFGYRHENQSGRGSYKVGKIMVLEGDHTQNPPPYFEGIKSVGQDVNEIVISSVKGDGNLFDTEGLTYSKSINLVAGIHYNEAYTETDQPQKRLIGLPIRLPQNSNLKTYFKCEGYQIAHAFFDKDLRFVQDRSWNPNTINISPRANEVYVSSYFKRDDDTIMSQSDIEFIKQNAIVTESDNFESITYTPYQSIKKTLLYYNEESQIWEKPILRSLPNGIKDTIEKHSDGKYYYHKRSEEIVLNGNEKDISIHGGVSVEGRTTIVIPYVRHYSLVYPTSSVHVYCDKLTPSSRDGLSDKSNVICFHGFNYTDSTTYNAWIGISVDNSKLDSHGLEGVKKWLSINTPTVIIPAITGKIEEVYECTNIDLQTFDNVTNIHVNSGSVPAIIKGSVTTTLSNTLSVLMDKIEVLENQDIVLNRIKLRSTYESYKTNFNIDIQSAHNNRSIIDPDNDIFKLLYLVISEGSHNYNRYEVEEQIDFYTIIEVLDYNMADYLFNLIDLQHPVYEEEVL